MAGNRPDARNYLIHYISRVLVRFTVGCGRRSWNATTCSWSIGIGMQKFPPATFNLTVLRIVSVFERMTEEPPVAERTYAIVFEEHRASLKGMLIQ